MPIESYCAYCGRAFIQRDNGDRAPTCSCYGELKDLTLNEVRALMREHKNWCQARREEELENLRQIQIQCPHDWPASDKAYICHYCEGIGRKANSKEIGSKS